MQVRYLLLLYNHSLDSNNCNFSSKIKKIMFNLGTRMVYVYDRYLILDSTHSLFINLFNAKGNLYSVLIV